MRPSPEEMAAYQARQAETEASSTTEIGRQPVPPDPQPSQASHAPQQQHPQPQDFHQAPINWVETIDRGDAIIQIPNAPGSRPFWNIDGVEPEERPAYFEKMLAWAEGEVHRAPHLTARAVSWRFISGFIGSLRLWWSNTFTEQERQFIMNQDCPYKTIISYLVAHFYGTTEREKDLAEKNYLQTKCCDVQQLKAYYLKQEQLFYKVNKPSDTMVRTFVLNMPAPVAEMLEAKFKSEGITNLSSYSLASLYQMATEVIHEHCRLQDLKKHMKQIEKTSLQKHCNIHPQLYGCHDSSKSCSCKKQSYHKAGYSITLTALIDTEAVSSIIHSKCVPPKYFIPTAVSFAVANGEEFQSRRYTLPFEILPFGIRHSFFVYDHTGEDILFGTDFLLAVAPATFHPEGFLYTVKSPDQQTSKLLSTQ
ncbi:polyprotein [Melia azedarach]|uniref:Polyprotein n=1 Tax=Melia azedarach TaxID=155640 RepID=A0ACC1Y5K5_MELAZ|nr:polyprotein [Melia azedarach]